MRAMLQQIQPAERRRMLRFAVVGLGVAGLYLLIYLALLGAGVGRGLANGVSFGTAVIVQYFAQTLWTFGRAAAVPDQIFRFAVTIGLGFLSSVLITGVVVPQLGWAEAWGPVLVMLLLPVQNYIIFRLWVYGAPERGAACPAAGPAPNPAANPMATAHKGLH